MGNYFAGGGHFYNGGGFCGGASQGNFEVVQSLSMEISKSTPTLKIVISILVWGICLPALFLYGLFSLASLIGMGRRIFTATNHPEISFLDISSIFGIAAWLFLAVMNVAWIKQHRLGILIPVIGTSCAVIGILPVGPSALLALPGVVFAIYLVCWHMYMKLR